MGFSLPSATRRRRRGEGEEEEKEKKKEKEKKEVGDRGAPVDHVAPCRRQAPCVPKQRLREGASPAFRRGAEGWHRAARSLGVPFTTMTPPKAPQAGKEAQASFLIVQTLPTNHLSQTSLFVF